MTILACIAAVAIGFPIGYFLAAAVDALERHAQEMRSFYLLIDLPMFPVEPRK